LWRPPRLAHRPRRLEKRDDRSELSAWWVGRTVIIQTKGVARQPPNAIISKAQPCQVIDMSGGDRSSPSRTRLKRWSIYRRVRKEKGSLHEERKGKILRSICQASIGLSGVGRVGLPGGAHNFWGLNSLPVPQRTGSWRAPRRDKPGARLLRCKDVNALRRAIQPQRVKRRDLNR